MSAAASPKKHILLIGGHGKVAQLLTPLLLSRGNYTVTSLIRSAEQVPVVERLGQGKPGCLRVVVKSLEDEVMSEGDARGVLEEVGVGKGLEWVVWCAGAGGRGGPSRTHAIDFRAAIAFTRASISTPSITKFLTVSYMSSRRTQPPWWSDAQWSYAEKINTEILPAYFRAKVAADEVLTVLSAQRCEQEKRKGVSDEERFCGISLRPGALTDEPKGGVSMGKIGAEGKVSRASVAEAVLQILEMPGARGWFDMLDGDEDVGDAVRRCVRDGVDCVEGEDLGEMGRRVEGLDV